MKTIFHFSKSGKTIVCFSFVICQLSLFSQDMPDFSKTKKIQLKSGEYSVWAEVYTSEKQIKTDDNKFYCWVKSNEVHTTQGSYDGRLLHGIYTEYYKDNQLKQKGEFKNGLREGEWKSWYQNGLLKEVIRWKNGKCNGKFIRYNEKGEKISHGKYSDDRINGKLHLKDSSGKDTTIIYKNGVPEITKEKKTKKPKSKKKEVIPLEEEKKMEEEKKADEPGKKKKEHKKKEKAEGSNEEKKDINLQSTINN